MGRACGRQPPAVKRLLFERRAHMPPEALLRLGPVEEHLPDRGMAPEKGFKIVRDDGCRFDAGIQAVLARAGRNDIPQRDPGRFQDLKPLCIGKAGMGAEELSHDRPETVSRMGIVLARRQRGLPGHAPQDQDDGIGIINGCETVGAGHPLSRTAFRVPVIFTIAFLPPCKRPGTASMLPKEFPNI